MTSLIHGYEYDIFISYRQKDNKYDGWVTEFVDNLKRELEATFKEEVSVYFDINPHDGLLETHDVDASLKEKLKCLVFIPIISRTYCDPKSFAWEHEFKAFVEEASKDPFGLKVRLPNGNVASRVLPVRIHDLDPADIKLCESVLGGVLRGVEFIYKEPGVNKPLTSEDDEKKNLNKTKYRIQINKIANAIKEIVSGLMAGEVVSGKEKAELQLPWEEVKKEKREPEKKNQAGSKKRRMLSAFFSIIILALLIAIYAYPKIFKRGALEKQRPSGEKISIAVLPFKNMTRDTIWNFWQDGIQFNLISSLSNIRELRVIQKDNINTVFHARGITQNNPLTTGLAGTISQNLDADIFVYGSIQQAGPAIRVDAQLIDTKTKEVLKSFSLDRPSTEKDIIQIVDTLSQRIRSFLVISKLIKEVYPDIQIDPLSTNSPEAFRYFIYGSNSMSNGDWNKSREWYLKALEIDSNFFEASAELYFMYQNSGMFDQSLRLLFKFYNRKEKMSPVHQITLNWMYMNWFGSPGEKIKCLRQVEENDDQNMSYPYMIGIYYSELNEYDRAITEFKKAIDLGNKWGIKYSWAFPALGETYHKMGKYNDEKKLYMKVEQDNPDNSEISFSWLIRNHAALSLFEKDTVAANKYIARYINICKENSTSEADIATGLAQAYRDAGFLDKSEKYFRKALAIEPENTHRMNRLAWFLIDKERNIEEGLALVDKALNLSPDKYTYFWLMDIRGWGLYKQGKFKESLELFEKIWEQRPKYDYDVYLHLEEVRNAVASSK
jgi:tetratricopeptide (TPR) repeat protein